MHHRLVVVAARVDSAERPAPDLRDQLKHIEGAWLYQEFAEARVTVSETTERLPCLDGPVASASLVRLHYLDALAAMPRTMDVAAQMPHHALRVYVMGERAARHEDANSQDIARMADLTEEAIRAGALGFTDGL